MDFCSDCGEELGRESTVDCTNEGHEEDSDSSDDEVFDDVSDSSDEEDVVDVWQVIADDAKEKYDNDVIMAYKERVKFSRDLHRDKIHKKVMHTLKRFSEEDDMKFSEALLNAIEKRKFIVLKTVLAAINDSEDEGDKEMIE